IVHSCSYIITELCLIFTSAILLRLSLQEGSIVFTHLSLYLFLSLSLFLSHTNTHTHTHTHTYSFCLSFSLRHTDTHRETHTHKLIYCTCPPFVVEKILMVPPHCLMYQRNHRADTSWGSEVTFTFTNRVANCRAALRERDRQRERERERECV